MKKPVLGSKFISIKVPVQRLPEIRPALELLYELKACAFLGRDMTLGAPWPFEVRASNGSITNKVRFYVVEYPNDL